MKTSHENHRCLNRCGLGRNCRMLRLLGVASPRQVSLVGSAWPRITRSVRLFADRGRQRRCRAGLRGLWRCLHRKFHGVVAHHRGCGAGPLGHGGGHYLSPGRRDYRRIAAATCLNFALARGPSAKTAELYKHFILSSAGVGEEPLTLKDIKVFFEILIVVFAKDNARSILSLSEQFRLSLGTNDYDPERDPPAWSYKGCRHSTISTPLTLLFRTRAVDRPCC